MTGFLQCSRDELEFGIGDDRGISQLPASRSGVRKGIIQSMARDFTTARFIRWLFVDRPLQWTSPKRGPMQGRRPGKIIEPAPRELSPDAVRELCGEEVDGPVAEPYAIRLCERRADRNLREALVDRSGSFVNEALTTIGMTAVGFFDPIDFFLGRGALRVWRGGSRARRPSRARRISDNAITETSVAIAVEILGRTMDPQADEEFDLTNEMISIGLGTAVRAAD